MPDKLKNEQKISYADNKLNSETEIRFYLYLLMLVIS